MTYTHEFNDYGDLIRKTIQLNMDKHGIQGTTTGMGSLVQCHFGISGNIRRPEELAGRNNLLQKRFQSLLLDQGVFFIPGMRGYVSAALGSSDIEMTLEAIEDVFKKISLS